MEEASTPYDDISLLTPPSTSSPRIKKNEKKPVSARRSTRQTDNALFATGSPMRVTKRRYASTGSIPSSAGAVLGDTLRDIEGYDPVTNDTLNSTCLGSQNENPLLSTGTRSPITPATFRLRKSTPTRAKSSPDPARPARNRPGISRASKSEPTPSSSRLSSSQLDSEVEKKMQIKLNDKEIKGKKLGYIYILEVRPESCPEQKLLKVGFSTDPQVRQKNILCKCKHRSLLQKEDPKYQPIRLYRRAETLIKAELKAFVHDFDCSCETKHTEYFDVEEHVMLEVVQRWRDFCSGEPYNKDGQLLPFWQRRLKHRLSYSPSKASCGYAQRARRWKKFVDPTRFETIWFDFIVNAEQVWPWRWHYIALGEALIAAILTYPSRLALGWTIFIALGFISEAVKLPTPFTANYSRPGAEPLHKEASSPTRTNDKALAVESLDTASTPGAFSAAGDEKGEEESRARDSDEPAEDSLMDQSSIYGDEAPEAIY